MHPELFSRDVIQKLEPRRPRFSQYLRLGTAALIIVLGLPSTALMQSQTPANGPAAPSILRSINTAEDMYMTFYPEKGYAANLAVLGPGGTDCTGKNVTPEHACLLDDTLSNASCTEGKWCEKSAYKFTIRPVCEHGQCLDYAVTAIPISSGSGAKSFCSTNDAVIRSHTGTSPAAPLTVAECRTWTPLR